MKDIKFRAWDGLDHLTKPFTLIDIQNGKIQFASSDTLIMQFTGLKDRNKKDIYEGDILQGVKKEQRDINGKDAYTLKEVIRWNNGGFEIFNKPIQGAYIKFPDMVIENFMWCEEMGHGRNRYYYQIDDIEVIGNIYENPELLTN